MELALEQRRAADRRQTLVAAGRDVPETQTLPRSQNHGSHVPSGTTWPADRRRRSSAAFDRYSCLWVALMPQKTNTSAYTRQAAIISAPIAGSVGGTKSRVASTYAVITAAGHTAGHTASVSARQSGISTRRQAAGNSTTVDAMPTGTSVAIATPGSPSDRTNAMPSPRLTNAAAMLVNATRRWRPAPLR